MNPTFSRALRSPRQAETGQDTGTVGRLPATMVGPHTYADTPGSREEPPGAGPVCHTMTGPSRDRSQSGLDRLLLFVVLVVVLVVVAPYVLGFVGVDVREDEVPDGVAAPDHDVSILAVRGEAIDTDRSSVGAVRLVVSPSPGREPVDLREGTAIWIGDRTYDLAPAGATAEEADGQYQVEAADGGSPVLESPTDRGVLRFDLGTDDVAEAEEFGDRLATGETATVVLVTPRGETLTRRVTVPERIPADDEDVWL